MNPRLSLLSPALWAVAGSLALGCSSSARESPAPVGGASGKAGTSGTTATGGQGGSGAGRGGSGGASMPSLDAAATDAPSTGGADGSLPPGAVVISELMYKPFFENAAEDFHEFVEIHNRGPAAARLAGWKLGGDAKFTFPDGTMLAPGAYLVLAKDRAKLAAVAKYGLKVADLLGDYLGELGDGKKNQVTLSDATGTVVDSVNYSAEFPWPMGADGLGLAPSWVPMAETHQFMGRSLERLSFDVSGSAVENWEASAIDGATPGKPNSVAGKPRAVVIEVSARPTGSAEPLIQPANKVTVRARFSELGTVTGVAIEYFTDDVARTDEKTTTVAATKADLFHQAELPAAAANSIVRYRILGDRGTGKPEVISPRPTDPNPWHAYFVNPDAPGKTRAYHVFISPTEWGNMWRNVEPGFVDGCGLGVHPECTACAVNQKWNDSVPAVFVSDGRVFDVRTRYQGGKIARLVGRPLKSWPFPKPNYGHNMPTFEALGWKVSFPKYARFDGARSIKLNKRRALCTGIVDTVVGRVFESVGIPQPRMRYARLYVNGGYYLYAMEAEEMDEDFLVRGFPGKAQGDLFECNSIRWDAGPWGWGDFRLLQPFCGYTEQQRYAQTYERKTLPWKDNLEFIALIKGLHAARAVGNDAVKKYFDDNFDRDKVMRHIAVINWAGAWDDDYHNYDLYRPPGGKWMMMSTDNNTLLLGNTIDGAGVSMSGVVSQSLYLGKQDEQFNWRDRWHFLKDSFLTVFKAEYDELLTKLAQSELLPATVEKYVDEAAAAFDIADAGQSLSAGTCDVPATQVALVKNFVRGRYDVMKTRLGF